MIHKNNKNLTQDFDNKANLMNSKEELFVGMKNYLEEARKLH